jgi:hypothetical protein
MLGTYGKLMRNLIVVAIATLFTAHARAAVVDAVEYHHAGFDHYFVTAFSDEIAVLDSGAFGGVWKRTGQSFRVESNQSSAASAAVCRFFSTSFAPRSSHFYTALASECLTLRSNYNWQYEGLAFYVASPTTSGACASGYSKVYRLYNNGKSGAPNHRYTTSTSVRTQMMGQGWVPEGYGEGVAFCSPNAIVADAYVLASRVLGGSWYMSYTYGTSYVDKITFTSVYRNTGTSSATMPYMLEGVGPFNLQVAGGYFYAEDAYIAMWRFSTGSQGYNGYAFKLTGNNSLAGCFDYDANPDNLFDYCYNLTGNRSPAKVGATEEAIGVSEAEQDFQKSMFRNSLR